MPASFACANSCCRLDPEKLQHMPLIPPLGDVVLQCPFNPMWRLWPCPLLSYLCQIYYPLLECSLSWELSRLSRRLCRPLEWCSMMLEWCHPGLELCGPLLEQCLLLAEERSSCCCKDATCYWTDAIHHCSNATCCCDDAASCRDDVTTCCWNNTTCDWDKPPVIKMVPSHWFDRW